MKFRSILIGLGLALAAPGASAVTMNSAGTICQPVDPDADFPDVYYTTGRVVAFSAAEVACAVPREAGSVQMTVYVDFSFLSGTQGTTCHFITYDRDGNPATTIDVNKTGTGWQRASATFTAAQNPAWGYTSVTCGINPNVQLLGVTAAY
jgi:hypothetical protein